MRPPRQYAWSPTEGELVSAQNELQMKLRSILGSREPRDVDENRSIRALIAAIRLMRWVTCENCGRPRCQGACSGHCDNDE